MKVEEFLKEKFKKANAIVLFGSYVREEKFNDVDVLVVGNFSEEYLEKVKKIFFSNFGYHLHIILLTKEEFFMNVLNKNPLFLPIFLEGKVLKDDGTFWEGRFTYSKLAKDLKVVKGDITWKL